MMLGTMTEFESKLNTNYVPMERERKSIKEYLVGPRKLLAELDRNILQQKAILEQMLDQRKQLETTIELYNTLISPFRRVPHDILREIFIRCLPDSHNATMSPHEAPVILGHVCSGWRHVALTTPALWSSLHIVTYGHPQVRGVVVQEEQLGKRDAQVQEWVNRSGALPLSLSFGSAPPSTNSGDIRRLLSLTSATFGRWDAVDMSYVGEYTENTDATFEMGDARNPFYRVRKLSLSVHLTTRHRGEYCDLQAANTFLRSLDLTRNDHLHELNLTFNIDPRAILSLTQFIPCSQLEVLNLQHLLPPYRSSYLSIKPDSVIALWEKCPNLIVFKANVNLTGQRPPEVMIMPNLKHISLFLSGQVRLGALMEPIIDCTTPRLSSLDLRGWGGRYHDIKPFLSVYIERIGTQLTSLTLDSSIPIVAFLPMVPALVQLHMRGWPSNDQRYGYLASQAGLAPGTNTEVIERLTPSYDGAATHPCPNLQYIKWEGKAYFSDNSLLKLLVRRATSAAPLKQVHILFGRPMEYNILPECAGLVGDGLDLQLVYQQPPGPDPSTRLFAKLGLPVHDNVLDFGWPQGGY